MDAERLRRPFRVRHSYTQSLAAPPAEVFPLLCPVRECEWVPGWRPDWVLSESGVAEPGCVFQSPGEEEGTGPAVWVISRHDAAEHRLEMVKVIPGHTVTRLELALAADGAGGTRAMVSYEFTALSPDGEAFVRQRTAAWYEGFMRAWEAALNAYLMSRKGLVP